MGIEVDSLDIALVAQAQSALKAMDDIIGKTGQMHTAIAKMMDSLNGNAYKRQSDAVKRASKEMSDSLIRDYNITGKEVQEQIRKMAKTITGFQKDLQNGLTVDPKKVNDAFSSITNTIKNNAKASTKYTNDLIDAFKTIKSMGKINVSDKIIGDLGDDWSKGTNGKRGYQSVLPNKFTRNPNNRGVDSVYKELSSIHPNIFNVDVTDTTKQFRRIIDVILEAKDAMANGAQDMEGQMKTSMKNIQNSVLDAMGNVRNTIASATSADAVNESFKGFDVGNMFGGENLGNLSGYLSDLATSLSKISTVKIGDIGLSQFANDLKTLDKVKFADICNGLSTLDSAVRGLSSGGGNLANIGAGLQQLVPSLLQLGQVSIGDIGLIQRRIDKLASINFEGLNKSAQAIYKMSNSLKRLSDIGASGETLEGFAKSINKLGYKSTAGAIENLPKLGKALREVMDTLSKSPQVSKNVIEMTNALANLSQSMRGVSVQAPKTNSRLKSFFSGIKSMFTHTKKANSGFKGLASAIGSLYAKFWIFIRMFGKLKEAINLKSQLIEVQNVVDVTFGDMRGKMQEFADKSMETFGMTELSSKQFASRFQAMGVAMGISSKAIEQTSSRLQELPKGYINAGNSMADMSLNLTALTADLASFYDVDQSAVAEDLQAVFTGMTRPLTKSIAA